MINKEEEYVLSVALASERIASEIVARIVNSTPASPAAAQAILDIIDNSKKEEKEIKEYLTVATANRSVGKEISEQLELIVECLEYQAADDPANDAALAAAQAKLSDLSDKAKEYLIVALSSRIVANSVSSKIDVATQSTSAIASAVPPIAPLLFENADVSGGLYNGLLTTSNTMGQSFRYTGANYNIEDIEIALQTYGTPGLPTGDMVLEIISLDGLTVHTTSSVIDMSILTTSLTWYKFNFPTPFAGTDTTQYRWRLSSLAGAVIDIDNGVVLHRSTVDYLDGGTYANNILQSDTDFGFKVYGTAV